MCHSYIFPLFCSHRTMLKNQQSIKCRSWHVTREKWRKVETYKDSLNCHRIRITEPNLTIFMSLFSKENVLSHAIKICDIFHSQSIENRPFRFFWDTRYIITYRPMYIILLRQNECTDCMNIDCDYYNPFIWVPSCIYLLRIILDLNTILESRNHTVT